MQLWARSFKASAAEQEVCSGGDEAWPILEIRFTNPGALNTVLWFEDCLK